MFTAAKFVTAKKHKQLHYAIPHMVDCLAINRKDVRFTLRHKMSLGHMQSEKSYQQKTTQCVVPLCEMSRRGKSTGTGAWWQGPEGAVPSLGLTQKPKTPPTETYALSNSTCRDQGRRGRGAGGHPKDCRVRTRSAASFTHIPTFPRFLNFQSPPQITRPFSSFLVVVAIRPLWVTHINVLFEYIASCMFNRVRE